ncbi:MAG TPA: RNA polymerase sigma factor [Rectinemataceae bacterium]
MKPQDADDDAAIGLVLSGDTQAYRIIVERYGPRMIAFCAMRLGSQDEARDLAQEVFLRAFSALKGFKRGESFSSWLFAIAANRIRTKFGVFASTQAKVDAVAIEEAVREPRDPSDEAIRSIQAAELRLAVASLPPELRNPVEYYYFAGLSVAQTAKLLGLSEEAVKTRLFRARAKLKAALEKRQPNKSLPGIKP